MTEKRKNLLFIAIILALAAVLNKYVESLYQNTFFIGFAFLMTGVLLFAADRMGHGNKNERGATLGDAVVVGLAQMIALRYGNIPIVRETGGLKDTVWPYDPASEQGRGFTFQSYNADDFFASLKRCLGLYNHNREAFRALQKRDMEQDFSWNVPARKYMEQFQNMLAW